MLSFFCPKRDSSQTRSFASMPLSTISDAQNPNADANHGDYVLFDQEFAQAPRAPDLTSTLRNLLTHHDMVFFVQTCLTHINEEIVLDKPELELQKRQFCQEGLAFLKTLDPKKPRLADAAIPKFLTYFATDRIQQGLLHLTEDPDISRMKRLGYKQSSLKMLVPAVLAGLALAYVYLVPLAETVLPAALSPQWIVILLYLAVVYAVVFGGGYGALRLNKSLSGQQQDLFYNAFESFKTDLNSALQSANIAPDANPALKKFLEEMALCCGTVCDVRSSDREKLVLTKILQLFIAHVNIPPQDR